MTDQDDLYSQVLTSGPSPGTLVLVLSKLKEAGRLIKVIEECLKALNLYPKDIQIRRLLAETYFEAGLTSQAETELEKVTIQIDDLVSSYKLQAELYAKQGKKMEAFEALKLYLAHRPDDQEALNLLETLEPIEEAMDVEPASHAQGGEPPKISTVTLAEIYYNQGQIEEAMDIYEKVVAQNPEDQRARIRLKELKAMKVADGEIGDEEFDRLRQKKERMIATLELWLAKIHEKAEILFPA